MSANFAASSASPARSSRRRTVWGEVASPPAPSQVGPTPSFVLIGVAERDTDSGIWSSHVTALPIIGWESWKVWTFSRVVPEEWTGQVPRFPTVAKMVRAGWSLADTAVRRVAIVLNERGEPTDWESYRRSHEYDGLRVVHCIGDQTAVAEQVEAERAALAAEIVEQAKLDRWREAS